MMPSVLLSLPPSFFASGLRGRLLATLAVVLLFGVAYGGFRAYDFWTNVRWAQDVAQPELAERIAVNDFAGAFDLEYPPRRFQ